MNRLSISRKLTETETTDLGRCKAVITKKRQDFEDVVKAVGEISERKLWRAEATNAAEFFHKNWGWSESYFRNVLRAVRYSESQRLIQDTTGEDTPDFTSVRSADRARKTEDKESLSEHSGSIKRERAHPSEIDVGTQNEEPLSQSKPVEPEPVKDDIGSVIPLETVPLWERRGEIKNWLKKLSEIKCYFDRVQEEGDKLYAGANVNAIIADVELAYGHLKNVFPYAVCPSCAGRPSVQPNGGCVLCAGRGLVSEFKLSLVPEEQVRMQKQMAKGQT